MNYIADSGILDNMIQMVEDELESLTLKRPDLSTTPPVQINLKDRLERIDLDTEDQLRYDVLKSTSNFLVKIRCAYFRALEDLDQIYSSYDRFDFPSDPDEIDYLEKDGLNID